MDSESAEPTMGRSSFLSYSPLAVKSYAAAVDKATEYFPKRFSKSISRRRLTPIPLLSIAVRLQGVKEEAYISVPSQTTIYQLRELIERETGVSDRNQQLTIEEDRPHPPHGVISALKSTANQLSSRERLRGTLINFVNFIFLPEAVNREVKGMGISNWFQEHILPQLNGPPPPHITFAKVAGFGGRKSKIEISSTATIQRLKEEVEKQTGLPLGSQRIVVTELLPQNKFEFFFWSIMKVVHLLISFVLAKIASWIRWIVVGAKDEHEIVLKLQKNDGSVIGFPVRQDTTLAELRHQVKLEHGDSIDLDAIVLSDTCA